MKRNEEEVRKGTRLTDSDRDVIIRYSGIGKAIMAGLRDSTENTIEKAKNGLNYS